MTRNVHRCGSDDAAKPERDRLRGAPKAHANALPRAFADACKRNHGPDRGDGVSSIRHAERKYDGFQQTGQAANTDRGQREKTERRGETPACNPKARRRRV